MNYNDMLASAINLASLAHKEQRDLHGCAYILHPLRVRQSIEDAGYSIPYQIVGALHDVLEDQPGYANDVRSLLPAELYDALLSVTRQGQTEDAPKEQYKMFILRAIEHPIGVVVKFFDVIDNFNVNRMHHKVPVERYKWALKQIIERNPELVDTVQSRHYDTCPDLISIINHRKNFIKTFSQMG